MQSLDLERARLAFAALPGFQVDSFTDISLRFLIGSVPVDVVRYPYPSLNPPGAGPDHFPVASPEDLATMKLSAASRQIVVRRACLRRVASVVLEPGVECSKPGRRLAATLLPHRSWNVISQLFGANRLSINVRNGVRDRIRSSKRGKSRYHPTGSSAMLKKMQALGAAVLCGLFVSAACSVKNASDNPVGSTGGGGAGGTATSGGGRGGTSSAHAGSGGKASGGPGGRSGDAGTGGESGAPPEPQCPACASGYCFADGTCVDCLPSDDHCPKGTVCGSTNTCVPGCKEDGTSCASGVCIDLHDCQNCIDDSECGGGNVCGDNQCAPACKAAQQGTNAGCSSGLTCCGLHCIDEQTDSTNCGACGTSCGKGQFCGLTECSDSGAGGEGGSGPGTCVACHDTVIANVCALPKVVVILDGQDGNQIPGRAMGAALAAQCNPAPALSEASQTVPDALNPASGRPVSGAHELLVAAGGNFFARLVGYVDSQKISPIYSYFDGETGTLEFRKSATDAIVQSRPLGEPSDSHDYFALQIMRDSITGSLVLNAEGFWESGTVAAAYFFKNGVLPNVAAFDKAWYVYDWTDKNGDMAPNLDEMTLVASGL